MTLVLLDEHDEIALEFVGTGVDPNNPQVKLLEAKGYGASFTIRDFGCRSPLKAGTGRKAQPILVHLCPACVVKVSRYNYDFANSPLSILCLQTKMLLFLDRRNQGHPVPHADLSTGEGIMRLRLAPTYLKRATATLGHAHSILHSFRNPDGSWSPTYPWPQDEAFSNGVSRPNYLTRAAAQPTGLEHGAPHIGLLHAPDETWWDVYRREQRRLEAVALAIAAGQPYGW